MRQQVNLYNFVRGSMTENEFDNFLQEACLSIHDLWTTAGGEELTSEELSRLNDVLTDFFERKQTDVTRLGSHR